MVMEEGILIERIIELTERRRNKKGRGGRKRGRESKKRAREEWRKPLKLTSIHYLPLG